MMTGTFALLVLCAATQDVAVDGWALTLLSPPNRPYAAACQLAGLNTGFYLSHPILLALSSPGFAARWGVPVLSLAWYLRFWAAVCFAVAAGLLLFKKEVGAPDAGGRMRSLTWPGRPRSPRGTCARWRTCTAPSGACSACRVRPAGGPHAPALTPAAQRSAR
jgi:hypothetical protein